MVKAIVIRKTGGPEVMEYVDVEVGEPGPGEVRIRHAAIGVNFIDIYFRIGLYPQPLPSGLGQEGAGVIESVGLGVLGFKPGDRVAYAGRPNGSYSEARLMPAAMLVKLPDTISYDIAAAALLQGLTVQYLFGRTFPVKEGDTILFHAAAGGVGLIAAQWARALGVKMIGTVSSDEKKALALAAGCSHVINSKTENIVERVKEFTDGKGVPAVFDSIGKDTFIDSLDCLSPLGTMVSFGSSSGTVPPFSLNELASRGSLSITRPSLPHYIGTRADLDSAAADLFKMIDSKKITIDINQRYALSDVGQAHMDLEARKTTGCTILIP